MSTNSGPRDPLDYFVDRTEVRNQISEIVRAACSPTLVEIRGIEGSGKTLLLAQVHGSFRQDLSLAIVSLSLRHYPLNLRRPDEAYRQLLIAVVNELQKYDADAFKNFADTALPVTLDVDLRGAEIRSGQVIIGSNTQVDVGGNLASSSLELSVKMDEIQRRRTRDQMTAAFIGGLTTLGARMKILVILDDAHAVLTSQVGEWFLGAIASTSMPLVIVAARSESSQELPWHPDYRLHLRNFNRSAVATYLLKRLPSTKLLEQLTDAICAFSAGHPVAVALAVDLIEQRGLDQQTKLIDIFHDLPAGRDEQLSQLVDEIIDSVDDAKVRKALDAAWVARHLDARLLAALLTETGSTPRTSTEFAPIVDRLAEYSFTERCQPSDPREPPVWRFNEFIRLERERRLATFDPETYVELHRRAATYYAQRMMEDDETHRGETSYLRTLRHDAPNWQSLQRDWFYHLAHLANRQQAGTEFAVMYLRSFYWWGWYERYSPCEDLIEDWKNTQQRADDTKWLDLITDFNRSYPTIWRQQDANWDVVEDVMFELQGLADADQNLEDLSPSQCHLRALTDLFMGQARLRREPPELSGWALYEEARALFEQIPEELWIVPWVAYWLGQTAFQLHDIPSACNELSRAQTLGDLQRDDELSASAWQFRGDIRVHCGDYPRAVRAYVLSVYAAFRFLGLPDTPDPYCRAFYEEIASGLVTRLQLLSRSKLYADIVGACAYIRAALSEIWIALNGPCSTADVDFGNLLRAGDAAGLRRALLLEYPPAEALTERLAVRRALAILRRRFRDLENQDQEDPDHVLEHASDDSSSLTVQRLHLDLGATRRRDRTNGPAAHGGLSASRSASRAS